MSVTTPWSGPPRSPDLEGKFPALGFVPCPGDQEAAADVASVVRDTADALRDIAHVLNGTGRGDWKGESAEAFREQFHDDFRPKVNDARDSFTKAAGALEDWARHMETSQRQAFRLEDEAQTAKDAVDSANTKLGTLPPKPMPWELAGETAAEKKKREELEDDHTSAERAVSLAENELARIRERARGLARSYQEYGEDIADRIKQAIDIAPNEPGWLDKLGAAIGELTEALGDIADQVLDALKDLAPLLDFIATAAGLLSTLMGLLSLIPGLQFLAVPALIFGGVALLTSYLSAAGKTGSFLKAFSDPTVITNAVTLAFGGGAFAAGLKLARVGSGGMSYGKLIADSMKFKPTVSSYPSFMSSVLTNPGVIEGGELAMNATRFSYTWTGNAFSMGPGGGYQFYKDTRDWIADDGPRPKEIFPNEEVQSVPVSEAIRRMARSPFAPFMTKVAGR
ncbi:WXG100 family type VII secretion target [Streptomyces sp. JJ66]|uniref:putative T7SS-secreted protein n=1 Tax=Streptomyces sp. JJ66 TaxID=2803843 RepID=UPI001C55A29F|nr:WXG100 family type VII secretion target [Streptomyces sp. JJ66]MBW1601186.1 WXG100 family type VII secretion target [Streptomyces sp. JJ66]